MNHLKKVIVIVVLFTCLLFILATHVFSDDIEKSGYEIIFKRNIAILLTDKNKAINPPILAMAQDGSFYLIEEYNEYFRLSLIDISFKKKREVLIQKASIDISGHIRITPLINNELIIQGFKRNTDYQERSDNKTKPFYYVKLLHFDKNLNIIKQIQIPRIGMVLPVISSEQNYYYMFGNSIHIMRKPAILKNYIIKIDQSGSIYQEIDMNDKTTDLLTSVLETGNIKIFSKNEFIAITNRDLFNKKNFNASSKEIWGKLQNNISIYLLIPEKKRMEKKHDLTDMVRYNYRKFNKDMNNENLLFIWDFYYSNNDKNVVFDIWEYSDFSTCGKILNLFIVKYNMEKNKFTMVKLGKEFERPVLIGYFNNLCYVFNWKTSDLYGLKLL